MRLYADLHGIKVGDDYPTRIVGVINLSPESFYKGSVKTTYSEIVKAATSMVEEGVDIIDVGGMSTAPYLNTLISVEEEIDRIVYAIRILKDVVNVPISVDTSRSRVAEAAVKTGASILNDVTGLKKDKKMAKLAAEYSLPLVVVAYGVKSGKGKPINKVIYALKESLNICRENGIPEEKVVVDPGIGFFRETCLPWYVWDCSIIKNLRKMRTLGRPIYIGVSRKSFIGKILNQDKPEERLYGSLSAAAIAVFNGAHIIRTHDVSQTLQAVRLAKSIREI